MVINKIDIWHLKLAFHSPFKHNLVTHESSENIVVKVTTGDGLTGYGEGIPRDFVTGETLVRSLNFLNEILAPAVLEIPWTSPRVLLWALDELRQKTEAQHYPAAFCALEIALLDAASQTWDMPLTHWLGARAKGKVVYSAVIPMATESQMAKFFHLVNVKQMRFLKLKVGNGSDLEILQKARQELGWQIDLRVDANSAWSATEALERIRAMQPYRISAVEQPVAKDDLVGLKKVSAEVEIPIIADESLCTAADAQRLIDMQACHIFNIRLSKCGGLRNALRIQEMAAKAGIRCQLGCHVGETSILSAAGRHFALGVDNLVYLEGSFSPYLLARDPGVPPVTFERGGIGAKLSGPGLGIQIDDHILHELAVSCFMHF